MISLATKVRPIQYAACGVEQTVELDCAYDIGEVRATLFLRINNL